MNQKVLQKLEYDKIIEMLAEKADSEPGKKLCRQMRPSVCLEEIRQWQTQTGDALNRLFKTGSTSFGSNSDLGFTIKSLEIGGTLSILELMKLAAMLDNVSRIKTYGKKDREDAPDDSLTELFEQLTPLTAVFSPRRRLPTMPVRG